MFEFPKVKKGLSRGLARLKQARNVVLGVALATSVGLAWQPGNTVAATPTVKEGVPSAGSGALLLAPAVVADQGLQTAYHYSHSSHSSHYSHSSHHSHYSGY